MLKRRTTEPLRWRSTLVSCSSCSLELVQPGPERIGEDDRSRPQNLITAVMSPPKLLYPTNVPDHRVTPQATASVPRFRRFLPLRGRLTVMQILVVDDDPAVRESLRRSLRFNGYEVLLADDGEHALSTLTHESPDGLVLDVMMPNLDGLATCRALRASGNDVPILMLTARDDVSDRVAGLDAGADDYLPKPFALEELLARLRALLRRIPSGSDAESYEALTMGDLSLEPATRDVRRGDREVRLTRTEFALLELLLRHPRQVLPRERILEEVWGYDFPTTANSLEVYVGYLRRKTEADGEPRLIHTVRGVGYVAREDAP